MTLDKNGFKRKTYDELLQDMSGRAKEEFGADANVTDGALAILIRIMAWFISLAWTAIEMVYHSSFIRTATGKHLDALLVYLGISRNLATYASGYVQFTGEAGYEVDIGFQVNTGAGVTFETYESGTIGANGTITLGVYAVAAGAAGNVAATTINTVTNPVAEITSVTNAEPTVGGAATETDDALRRRARRSVEGMGDKTRQALEIEILETRGVSFVQILENTGTTTDANNTPAHAFQPIVYGGESNEIAAAILRKKAHGIRSFGTTVIATPDIGGTLHQVGFTKATKNRIYVRGTITRDNSFPSNGENIVNDAMINYIGGVLSDGTEIDGLGMGQTVSYAILTARAALSVGGISDITLSISKDGQTYNQTNITSLYNQVAELSVSDIEVSYIV